MIELGEGSEMSLTQCLDAFIADCRSRDYSEGTLAGYRKDITVFIQWAWLQGCLLIGEVNGALLQRYQSYLLSYRSQHGRLLKPSTQKTYFACNAELADPARHLGL